MWSRSREAPHERYFPENVGILVSVIVLIIIPLSVNFSLQSLLFLYAVTKDKDTTDEETARTEPMAMSHIFSRILDSTIYSFHNGRFLHRPPPPGNRCSNYAT